MGSLERKQRPELMRRAGFANVRYENRLLGTMGINIGEAPLPL